MLLLLALACDPAADVGTPTGTDDTDCGPSQTWYPDADGDTYGDPEGAAFIGCDPPGGFVLDRTDCDDAEAGVYPGATEACDGLDQDCDGQPDVGLAVWYTDGDGDGFGDIASAVETCDPPEGAIAEGGDCNDTDAAVHPGADEGCDGDDDDCDGVADLGELGIWHSDVDGDGYGSAYDRIESCSAPEAGYTQTGGDCQPSDPTTYPGAVESCNDNDDDCDGDIDEDFEADGDGFRSDACEDGDDCDDTRADVYPDAEDACEDGVDQDCSGADRTCGFDVTVDLNTVATLYGASANDAGRQLKVGDFDGDGDDDLLIAAMGASSYWGGGWVYTADTLASGDLDDVAYAITSEEVSLGAGRSIGAGDMDGDGVADLGFGVPYPNENGMRLVMGPIAEDHAFPDEAIWLIAPPGTYAGHGADVGDVNGDGIEDPITGAYNDESGRGGVYVAYGPITEDIYLGDEADAHLIGEGGLTGRWIRADGDFNGDGVSDILAAAPYGSGLAPQAGGVYMVYGPPTEEMDLSVDFDGRYLGVIPNEYAGTGIGDGDVDGDGLDEVLVGSVGAAYEGVGYVFFGPAAGDYDTSAADIAIAGAAGTLFASDLVAADLDADGDGELVIGGAYGPSGVWVFEGLVAGSYDTTAAFSSMPTLVATDGAGTAVQIADLDSDSMLEVIIGAPGEATNGAAAGAVYMVEYAR